MRHSNKIASLITTFIMAVSFTSCNEKVDDNEISEPEESQIEEITPEEQAVEYKLETYWEKGELSETKDIVGEVTAEVYAGNYKYVISDDITYSSKSGYKMTDFNALTLKKGEYYNAPDSYVPSEADAENESVPFIEGAETIFSVCKDRILYSDGSGVLVYFNKGGTVKTLDTEEAAGMKIVGASFDGTKYTVAYEEAPITMKRFYVTSLSGSIYEETKLTMNYGGIITGFCTDNDDLYFSKSVHDLISDGKGNTTETTQIELYRMKTDGTLTKVSEGPKVGYRCTVKAIDVTDDGNICVLTNNLKGAPVVQKYIQSDTIATETPIPEGVVCDTIFCYENEVWLAYRDEKSISLAPFVGGQILTDRKVKTISYECKSVLPGDNKYDIYLVDNSSVYGYKLSDGTYDVIMDGADSEIPIKEYPCLAVIDSSTICFSGEDGPFALKKADDTRLEQLNSKRIVTVAGDIYTSVSGDFGKSFIPEKVREFNGENDKYFIHTVNYTEMEELLKDIEKGFSPDFIVYDADDVILEELPDRVPFADFKELMSDDSEVKYDDFMENITSACMDNGIMFTLFPYFEGTTIIQDEAYAEDDKMWTMKKYLETVDTDITEYRYNIEALEDLLSVFINTNTDFEKFECDYDNKDLKDLLEWTGEFISEEEYIQNKENGYYDNPNPDYRPPVRKYRISTPWEFSREQAENYDDVYIKGWPSDNETGMEIKPGICFSVLKSSGAKDCAWQFVKQFFTDEFYDNCEHDIFSLPLRKSAMEKMISDNISLKRERELYGEDYYPVYTIKGETYPVPEITEETEAKFRKAVYAPVFMSRKENELYSIIKEEAKKYYDSGTKLSAVASEIQKKATAYLDSLKPTE